MRNITSSRTIGAATAVLIAAVSTTFAAPRTDVTQLSCEQAQTLIAQRGAAVVTTGPRTYKRFVSDNRFCDAGEHYLHPAFTPTADKRSCYIGYTCESWNYYFSDDD
jgi:hypothetical protein